MICTTTPSLPDTISAHSAPRLWEITYLDTCRQTQAPGRIGSPDLHPAAQDTRPIDRPYTLSPLPPNQHRPRNPAAMASSTAPHTTRWGIMATGGIAESKIRTRTPGREEREAKGPKGQSWQRDGAGWQISTHVQQEVLLQSRSCASNS